MFFFHPSNQVEVTQVSEEVDSVVSYIQHRYINYDRTFGVGMSNHLSPFLARIKDTDKKVTVEGVDASDRVAPHVIQLSKERITGHKFDGTVADCVKLCKAFSQEVVYNLTHRMQDLRRLGGTKLFKVEKWLPN
ncbi:unnamed protein product [Closterium sp. NIES-54]